MFAHMKDCNVLSVKVSLDDMFKCTHTVYSHAIVSMQEHHCLCEWLHPYHQLAGFLISDAHKCQSQDHCHSPL